jgi:hypothetical protein
MAPLLPAEQAIDPIPKESSKWLVPSKTTLSPRFVPIPVTGYDKHTNVLIYSNLFALDYCSKNKISKVLRSVFNPIWENIDSQPELRQVSTTLA